MDKLVLNQAEMAEGRLIVMAERTTFTMKQLARLAKEDPELLDALWDTFQNLPDMRNGQGEIAAREVATNLRYGETLDMPEIEWSKES